jgi:serine/threonine-protein kinase RsbW
MKEHHSDAAPNGGAANGNPSSVPAQRPGADPTGAADARRPEAPAAEMAAAQHGSENGAAPPARMRVNLEFDFPSDVGYIERVVGVVIRQCEEFAFSARQCALNVPVALTEALSNAILRGNGEDRRKHVRVRARVDERELVMEVTDEGKGFDFDSCMADPTAPENLSKEDGRGLYLMRRLMDRVERFNDQGNVVRLTLRRG